MKKRIKHTPFYLERYGFGVHIHILMAQIPDAVYYLSSLVSQRTIQMTDSIKNPSIDFRILLLSQLPLPAPAQSILQRDYIDSGKGDVIQWSMSASAVWRWERWRLLLLWSVYVFMWILFTKAAVCIDAHMDFCDCALCVRHAPGDDMHGLRVLRARHWLSGTVEPLVCLHWSEEGFYGGAIGREREAGGVTNNNDGW